MRAVTTGGSSRSDVHDIAVLIKREAGSIQSVLDYHSSTLLELLRSRAAETPDRYVYTFLGDPGAAETHVTYGELDRRARAIGARLREIAVEGERAVLLYPPGADFVAGLFGALYAGLVAVPAYPPDPTRLERTPDCARSSRTRRSRWCSPPRSSVR
jgi:acyl-CoA synthetase (AMP-forming)/AMP-acid ligase II